MSRRPLSGYPLAWQQAAIRLATAEPGVTNLPQAVLEILHRWEACPTDPDVPPLAGRITIPEPYRSSVYLPCQPRPVHGPVERRAVCLQAEAASGKIKDFRTFRLWRRRYGPDLFSGGVSIPLNTIKEE